MHVFSYGDSISEITSLAHPGHEGTDWGGGGGGSEEGMPMQPIMRFGDCRELSSGVWGRAYVDDTKLSCGRTVNKLSL